MVPVVATTLNMLPSPIRERLSRHAELVKFALVGGSSFIIDTAIFIGLKSTVLESKPVTAKVISTLVATIYNYVLSRQWSFRTRGGRRGHHEAMLFFLVSGIGIAVTSIPLWLSRYGFHLETPQVSRVTQEVADFVSAQIVGTLLAMAFRWWAFRRFVFPHADVRPRHGKLAEAAATAAVPIAADADPVDVTAAELLGDAWPLIDDGEFDADGITGEIEAEEPTPRP
jgi:putative flippase GtrA